MNNTEAILLPKAVCVNYVITLIRVVPIRADSFRDDPNCPGGSLDDHNSPLLN